MSFISPRNYSSFRAHISSSNSSFHPVSAVAWVSDATKREEMALVCIKYYACQKKPPGGPYGVLKGGWRGGGGGGHSISWGERKKEGREEEGR